MIDNFQDKVGAFLKFRSSVHRAGDRHKVEGLDFVMALSAIIANVIVALPEEKREGALAVVFAAIQAAVECSLDEKPERPQ